MSINIIPIKKNSRPREISPCFERFSPQKLMLDKLENPSKLKNNLSIPSTNEEDILQETILLSLLNEEEKRKQKENESKENEYEEKEIDDHERRVQPEEVSLTERKGEFERSEHENGEEEIFEIQPFEDEEEQNFQNEQVEENIFKDEIEEEKFEDIKEDERNERRKDKKELKEEDHFVFKHDEQIEETRVDPVFEKNEILYTLRKKKKYSNNKDFPEFNEFMPTHKLKSILQNVKRDMNLESNVQSFRGMFAVGLSVMEQVCTSYLSINMSGFASQEMQKIQVYDPIIVEIGERSYLNWSSDLPPEMKLFFMVLMNAAMFVFSKDGSMLGRSIIDGFKRGRMTGPI